MQFANSGSLEDFILARTLPALSTPPEELTPEQLKAARRRRKSGNLPEAHFRHGELRGVHLLGWEEIRFIFGGVVRGLQYLVCISLLSLSYLPLILPLFYFAAQSWRPSPRPQMRQRPAPSRGRPLPPSSHIRLWHITDEPIFGCGRAANGQYRGPTFFSLSPLRNADKASRFPGHDGILLA